jgi:hypothetical protein
VRVKARLNPGREPKSNRLPSKQLEIVVELLEGVQIDPGTVGVRASKLVSGETYARKADVLPRPTSEGS